VVGADVRGQRVVDRLVSALTTWPRSRRTVAVRAMRRSISLRDAASWVGGAAVDNVTSPMNFSLVDARPRGVWTTPRSFRHQ